MQKNTLPDAFAPRADIDNASESYFSFDAMRLVKSAVRTE
jgi:hypothetical protein